MRAQDVLTIGDLANRTGLSVSAIRFYEEKGLVASTRNAGGQRRFMRSDIRRLSFVLIAQQLGFTIEQIRQQLLSLPLERTPTKSDWTKMSHGFRQERAPLCLALCGSHERAHLSHEPAVHAALGPTPSQLLEPPCSRSSRQLAEPCAWSRVAPRS